MHYALKYILSFIFQSRKKDIRDKYKDSPLEMGLAVAPKLKRSSWIQWKTNLEQNNKTETNFIVVRHPFERLVSAYRDKLERSHVDNYQTDFYYKKYGQKIVKKYRQKATSIFGKNFFR